MKYKEQRKLIYLKYNFSSMINLGVKGQRVDLSRDTFREKEQKSRFVKRYFQRKREERIIWGFSSFFKTTFSKKL